VEATVVSINQKGSFGFATIDAAGAAKLGLGEHTRMFFSTAEVTAGALTAKFSRVGLFL
jgi:hypothetical protein